MKIFSIIVDISAIILFGIMVGVSISKKNESAKYGWIYATLWAINSLIKDIS
jgi:hypothetical protein